MIIVTKNFVKKKDERHEKSENIFSCIIVDVVDGDVGIFGDSGFR